MQSYSTNYISNRPMKKISKTLLILMLLIVTATSCGKDEPDGKWEKMKWKEPSNIVKLQEGVYRVPTSGGSFTFICENYEPWIVFLAENGPYVSYEYPGVSVRTLIGEWCSVECVKKKVTFTFSPVSDDEVHDFEVTLTAGDIFYTFLFTQSNRLY